MIAAVATRDYLQAAKLNFGQYLKSKRGNVAASTAHLYYCRIAGEDMQKYKPLAVKHLALHTEQPRDIVLLYPQTHPEPESVLTMFQAGSYLRSLGDRPRLVNFLSNRLAKKYCFEFKVELAKLSPSQQLASQFQQQAELAMNEKDKFYWEQCIKAHILTEVLLKKQKLNFLEQLVDLQGSQLTFPEELQAIFAEGPDLQPRLLQAAALLQSKLSATPEQKHAIILRNVGLIRSMAGQTKALLAPAIEKGFTQDYIQSLLTQTHSGRVQRSELLRAVKQAEAKLLDRPEDCNLRLRVCEALLYLGEQAGSVVQHLDIKGIQHHTLGHLVLRSVLRHQLHDDLEESLLLRFLKSQNEHRIQLPKVYSNAVKHGRFSLMLETKTFDDLLSQSYARPLYYLAIAQLFQTKDSPVNVRYFLQRAKQSLSKPLSYLFDSTITHRVLQEGPGFLGVYQSLQFTKLKIGLTLAESMPPSAQVVAGLQQQLQSLGLERSYDRFILPEKHKLRLGQAFSVDKLELAQEVKYIKLRLEVLLALAQQRPLQLQFDEEYSVDLLLTLRQAMRAVVARIQTLRKKAAKKRTESEQKQLQSLQQLRKGVIDCATKKSVDPSTSIRLRQALRKFNTRVKAT